VVVVVAGCECIFSAMIIIWHLFHQLNLTMNNSTIIISRNIL